MRPTPRTRKHRRRAPLWREVLGARLREARRLRDETLTEVADRAGVSPQYLSEIERGRKEPSSEMIEAVAGALQVPLPQLLTLAATDLGASTPMLAPVAPRSRSTVALALAA